METKDELVSWLKQIKEKYLNVWVSEYHTVIELIGHNDIEDLIDALTAGIYCMNVIEKGNEDPCFKQAMYSPDYCQTMYFIQFSGPYETVWQIQYYADMEIHNRLGVGPVDLKNCSSLNNFVHIINTLCDWEPFLDDIIVKNGWVDERNLFWGAGLCSSKNERAYFSDEGVAWVADKGDEDEDEDEDVRVRLEACRTDVSDLIGKTVISIDRSNDCYLDSESLIFTCSTGEKYKMCHKQECCESVYIDDICGDLNDLIGVPMLRAEEVSDDSFIESFETRNADDKPDSYTFTFYKFATKKGYVDIRWYGESNGCYSEEVEFEKIDVEENIQNNN